MEGSKACGLQEVIGFPEFLITFCRKPCYDITGDEGIILDTPELTDNPFKMGA